MKRYLRILFLNAKYILLSTLEYRVSYLFRVFRIFLSIGLMLLTLNILFSKTESFAGWTKSEVFLVFSIYQFVSSFINLFCGDSLTEVPSLVRQGGLDIILLKPLDPQFSVSFKEAHPGNIYRILISLIIFGKAVSLLGEKIAFGNLLLGFLFIAAAIVIFYSLMLLIASASFYILEESLSELFENFLSVSKYPADIFSRGFRILLTIIPIVFLVTIPASVILDKFLPVYLLAFPIALFLFYFSRRCFFGALRSYTGAGG